MWWLLPAALTIGLLTVPWLLDRISRQNGRSNEAAAAISAQALAFSDAFVGSTSSENPPWDQTVELAPPVQIGF